jgi:hypothetical protein
MSTKKPWNSAVKAQGGQSHTFALATIMPKCDELEQEVSFYASPKMKTALPPRFDNGVVQLSPPSREGSPMGQGNLSLQLTCLIVVLLASPGTSNGQEPTRSGRPIEGSTGGLYVPNQSQSSLQSDLDPGVKVHLDPYGKRCILVAAYALPKTDFRKIFGAELSAHSSPKDKGKDASGSVGQDARASKAQNYEHMVSAQNRCSHTIRLRVCYLGSQSCVPLAVPAYGRQQASLGIATGTPAFRYQYTEQF